MMRNMRQKRKATTRDRLYAEKLRICRIEFLKLVLKEQGFRCIILPLLFNLKFFKKIKNQV